MCFQASCRDWQISPRDPELWAWDHDCWGIWSSPLGSGWACFAFCLQEESKSYIWWFKEQIVAVMFLIIIPGFLISGHMEGLCFLDGQGFVKSSGQWIVGGWGVSFPLQDPQGICYCDTDSGCSVSLCPEGGQSGRCQPTLDAHIQELFVGLSRWNFGLSGNITYPADTHHLKLLIEASCKRKHKLLGRMKAWEPNVLRF